ncbi:MAG: SDR family oxidoreductase [Rhodospirillaceae bacterium]|nr:SDR family oxidoreductase [Rhodospirillaceae bacterium]
MDDLRFPTFSLDGKCAFVTGASRGIGQAISLGLARAGADLILAARDPATLEPTAGAVRAMGREARVLTMDVADLASIRSGFAELGWTEHLRPDILINNAGVEEVCASDEVREALWDRIVDTNLKGAFFCAQEAHRLMRAKGGGAIVNVCSLTSGVGVPTAVPYGSSKTGLLGMTRALAAEWARDAVRVNAIGPGYFRTALTEVFYRDEDWAKGMLAKIPAGRFGRLDDLIGPVVFLCSDAAAYVTGQLLYIDGGFMASI